jgi:hypothetical protein
MIRFLASSRGKTLSKLLQKRGRRSAGQNRLSTETLGPDPLTVAESCFTGVNRDDLSRLRRKLPPSRWARRRAEKGKPWP